MLTPKTFQSASQIRRNAGRLTAAAETAAGKMRRTWLCYSDRVNVGTDASDIRFQSPCDQFHTLLYRL